jgi:geranylgeranyl pyrophosphate synthase
MPIRAASITGWASAPPPTWLAFQAAGGLVVLESEAPLAARLATLTCLEAMALTVAQGQALDARNPDDEAGYWHLIALKSGPFFGAALQAGALLAGADATTADGLYRLGHLIGEIVQLHDDLSDTLAVPANPDWLLGRLPLPILYAQSVPHPEQASFLALRGGVADPAILEAAQSILLRCGAVSYCLFQLQERDRLARQLLSELALSDPSRLTGLLDDLIRPVDDLLAGVAA